MPVAGFKPSTLGLCVKCSRPLCYLCTDNFHKTYYYNPKITLNVGEHSVHKVPLEWQDLYQNNYHMKFVYDNNFRSIIDINFYETFSTPNSENKCLRFIL